MNNLSNGKKYAVIAGIVLIVVLVGIYIVEQGMKNLAQNGRLPFILPTPVTTKQQKSSPTSQSQSSTKSKITENQSTSQNAVSEAIAKSQVESIKKVLPLETDDFVAAYAPQIDRVVVTRKTPYADQAFYTWIKNAGYPALIDNIQTTVISDKTMEEVQTPYVSPAPGKEIGDLILFFNLLLQSPVVNTTPAVTPTSTLPSNEIRSSSSSSKSSSSSTQGKNENSKYTYYSQCDGPYDNYPLAQGCNLCQAGCGPTTVAMILSSYVDKKYTPPAVVDIYKKIGAAACGTGLSYAKDVIETYGGKTTDYILPYSGNAYDAKDIVSDLKPYIQNGWTIFALASYCDKGCGHYFWITDIDAKGNILAYDPYYGKNSQAPINENSRYPFPKYLSAFGVKK